MQKLEWAANAARDCYCLVIDSIARHPHLAFWSAAAAMLALAVI
jgi:hypothetical protein